MAEIFSQDALFFFEGRPGALELYAQFARRLLALRPEAEIRVQKTQISFYDGRMIACVSLAPVRRKGLRPEHFITVTFGLDRPLDNPRAVVVPVRPNRFTHHVIVGDEREIDDQLMGWVDLAGTSR